MRPHIALINFILAVAGAMLFASCSGHDEPEYVLTQDDKDALEHYSYHSIAVHTPGGTLLDIPYRLLDPVEAVGAPDSQKYPLVVFLHGKNQQGTDNKSQMLFSPTYFYEHQPDYPCYVAFPQCPVEYYWSYPRRPSPMNPEQMYVPETPTPMYDAVLHLVEDLCRQYPIDRDRVILAGFSMGAVGALDIAARSHGVFAGVASIAGGIRISRVSDLLDKSVWVEHCMDDVNLNPELSLALIKTLGLVGCDLEAHIYPTGSHIAFHLFENDAFMQWVYTRKLKDTNL